MSKAADPIWGTLTKLQSEVIRLTGEQRIAMCEKQLKEFDFEVKKLATENTDRTPGSNRYERTLASFDLRVSRIEEKIEEHIKQFKNSIPQEKVISTLKEVVRLILFLAEMRSNRSRRRR